MTIVMANHCETPTVTFFPPLYHQRRIWILDILRRERLTEVRVIRTNAFDRVHGGTISNTNIQIVDIGCGEGALLATLCQPAPWLRPGRFQDDDHELSSLFDNVGLNDEDTPDLHATHIAGLDISSSQLEIAAQSTSPASVNPLYTRWEPLDVGLWQGSVDVINPAFVGVQCIVASELIEHLPDDILVRVAPVVLGAYQPRLFLVTTPSYTFNGRWSPPGVADPQGYPDPTRRTNRVFRHHDHKFEWTVDEFVRWCKNVARQWGYAVETTTIGVPKEPDPWGREGILGGATQVASFRRLDDRFFKAVRERGAQAIRSANNAAHTLVTRHHHEAHPRAGLPSAFGEIEEAILSKFLQWGEVTLGVLELWFADNLPILCGGSIDAMLDVAEQSTRLDVQRVAGQRYGTWKIQLIGELARQVPQEITSMEDEDVMCEDDDEPDYDAGETSFDSGVHMGLTYDGAPWCREDSGWAQVSSEDGWATNWGESGTDTSHSEWNWTI